MAIVTAKHVSRIQATVVCAKANGSQICIRSGGDDYEGLFFILDMFNLRSIILDVSRKKAWVQAGATLGELYTKISDASETLAFPAGVCSTVGAGGHISGGGYGNLMRKYGITVNKTLEQAGGEPMFSTSGSLSHPNSLKFSLFIRAMPQVVNRTIAVILYAQFLGRANELVSIMNQSLTELELKRQDCQEMSWLNTTLFWEDLSVGTPTNRPSRPETFFKTKSDYVKKQIPKEGNKKLWKSMLEFNNNVYMQWNPYGGVMDKVPVTVTPFPHRKGNLFKVQYYTSWLDANATIGSPLNMMKKYEVAEPYMSSNPREAFLNYRDIDIGSKPSGETNVYM
ncbi:hypothetical protein Bca101_006498 [Brassica carinata]